MSVEQYLNMQRGFYESDAARWSLTNRDHVVGSYDQHNQWQDYDTVLFEGIDTSRMVALEYGCGPGRNIIRFNSRFTRIDGVDISQNNIEKARLNLTHNSLAVPNLMVCDGKSIPVEDETYDLVFSVICLQHICVHEIRYAIMEDVYRVLREGGYFCFQMGANGKTTSQPTAGYFDNIYHATATNSAYDVTIHNPEDLVNDLRGIGFGFDQIKYSLRTTGPGDAHRNWLWVQARK